MPRILILDGNSLANRAFYALPMLTTADGRPTNVLHGFMTMLLRLQSEQQPDYWVVAFDKTKATVRIDQYAGYKAQRKATPEDLRPQFAYLKELLQGFAVPILELEGYEADDVIATVTTRAEQAEMEIQIYTGDRDALQLVSPLTKVFMTKKGISEVECYDVEALKARYQLRPEQIIDLKGLMGDSSDNIPGVPGVGEKTALKLLWEYETLENVLEHAGEVSGKKLQSNLVEYAEQARLSKKLATMIHDVPLEFEVTDLSYKVPDTDTVNSLLTQYSLRSVMRIWQDRVRQGGNESGKKSEEQGESDTKNQEEIQALDKAESGGSILENWPLHELTENEWLDQIAEWRANPSVLTLAFRTDETFLRQRLWSEFGIAVNGETFGLEREKVSEEIVDAWSALLTDPLVPKVVSDGKKLAEILLNGGTELNGISLDLSLAAYLQNSARSAFSALDLVKDYFPRLIALESVTEEAAALAQVAPKYVHQTEELGLAGLLHDIEEPLSLLLAKMEHHGIRVDTKQLELYGDTLKEELKHLEDGIYGMAEGEFNLNSPQQLGHVLFEKLGLPPKKKTKTGYSTDAETLEELRPLHPMIDKLLTYRQMSKLLSTYVNGLLTQAQDERIHTTFQQTVTATGRLSSTEPNLQNIPIRMEEGRRLRKVFHANQTDWVLFSADYSQIELRILAHYSQDELLCESFALAQDVHARTAAEVFEIPITEVTSDMRRKAKAVNFGLVYGLTDFGLSRDLGIPRKEAKFYVEQYFARYAGVKRYLTEVVEEAKQTGEVRTLFNRLRRIPELRSANRVQRQFGERIAMNTPVQGTAADIMKLAMLAVDQGLMMMNSKANILLQVHDELVLEVPPEELKAVAAMVKERMEMVYPLAVPLTVDMKSGDNWFDMKALTL